MVLARATRRFAHCSCASLAVPCLNLSQLSPRLEKPRIPPQAPGVRAAEPRALRQDEATPGLLRAAERKIGAESLHAAKTAQAGAARRKRHRRSRSANHGRRATGDQQLAPSEPPQERCVYLLGPTSARS